MVKLCPLFRISQPGEWKQGIAILHEGCVIGFVDHETTQSGSTTKTRNLQGQVLEGECLEWLLRQIA